MVEEADLLTGCHISGAQLRAPWRTGRSTACGQAVGCAVGGAEGLHSVPT